MSDNPANIVEVDGSAVDKSVFRAWAKARIRLRVANAAEVNGKDYSDAFGIEIPGGYEFDKDAADTTTADDGGVFCIVDIVGTRFKRFLTGVGGSVTQATSKSTAVTLSKLVGKITMNAALLASNTSVSFTVTNTQVSATDVVAIALASGGTAGSYFVTIGAIAAGSFVVHVRNVSGGSLSEALVLNFAVTKATAV